MKRIIYLLLAVLLLTCGCTKAPRQSSSLKQYNITGGTFIALGSSGMAQNFSEAQNQSSVLVNFDNTSGGTPFAVCDSSGKVLITFTPQNSYSSAVFTSPDIKSGNSYILKSDVNELTTVEVTSSVVGSGGMNPGGGMGPGGMRPQRSDGENRHQKPMR